MSPNWKDFWLKADAVCFDVDSTVSNDEGIDLLANICGAGDEVAAWTNKAMSGNTTFEQALAARLDIIKPSRQDLENLPSTTPSNLYAACGRAHCSFTSAWQQSLFGVWWL